MNNRKLIRLLAASAIGAASTMLFTANNAVADDEGPAVCTYAKYSTDSGNSWSYVPFLPQCDPPCIGANTGVITAGPTKAQGQACVKEP